MATSLSSWVSCCREVWCGVPAGFRGTQRRGAVGIRETRGTGPLLARALGAVSPPLGWTGVGWRHRFFPILSILSPLISVAFKPNLWSQGKEMRECEWKRASERCLSIFPKNEAASGRQEGASSRHTQGRSSPLHRPRSRDSRGGGRQGWRRKEGRGRGRPGPQSRRGRKGAPRPPAQGCPQEKGLGLRSIECRSLARRPLRRAFGSLSDGPTRERRVPEGT